MNLTPKKDKHPLAINIKKLQRYNYNYFSCEEVVFFEYMVVKGNSFKQKPFYHSSETIFNETGIKKHSLNSIIKRFIALEYISIEVKGMPKVKHFTIHYPKIQDDLSSIYLLEENGQPLYDFRQLLNEFYLPLVKTYQEKYNINNINKNNKKEKEDSISEKDTQKLKIFGDSISSLKSKFNLTTAQCNYNDFDVIVALEHYKMEELTNYLEKYFHKNNKAKITSFFKFSSLNTDRLDFIEQLKMEEEKYIEDYIKVLQDSYDNRMKMFNADPKNKRGKSKTTLVINRNIKEKIKEAIENKGEISITHAFMAYTDAVLKEEISPDKFLPYFFSKQYGEFGVIETYLDYFNLKYSYEKK